jgi:membrane protease YdiL (CAAX protease family)
MEPDLANEPAQPSGAENRRPGTRELLIGIAIIWAIDLGAAIAMIGAEGWKTKSSSPLTTLLMSVLSGAGTLAVIWSLTCRKYHLSFTEGFSLSKVGRRTAIQSAVAGILLAAASAALVVQFGTDESTMEKLVSKPGGLVAVCFMALVLPPIEELYYRGFIYPALERKWGGTAAVVIVTLWFVAIHVPQLAGNWILILPVLMGSTVLTLQRHRTKSLTPSMITHWVYNCCLVVISLLGRT